MEESVLLYDAKCGICRDLALKVRANAKEPIEIMALSDPEAVSMLEGFYPDGWKHDFYLMRNGTCRRGVLALPRLWRMLGLRNLGALVGEYASFKSEQARCSRARNGDEAAHAAGSNGMSPSRRQVVTMAAAAPFLASVSKLSALGGQLETPLRQDDAGIQMNLAVVWRDAAGVFHTDVKNGARAVRRTGEFKKKDAEVRITDRSHAVLEKSAHVGDAREAPQMSLSGEKADRDGLEFLLQRNSLKGEKLRNGAAENRFVDSYSLGVDHARYNISLNVGRGTLDGHNGTVVATTLSGMIGHDLALPLIDYVVFAGSDGDDAATHYAGYVEGVKALRRFHEQAGRARVAKLYREIETGLAQAVEIYDRNVSESLVPVKSKLVLTSMPELLQFVDYHEELARMPERLPLSEGAKNFLVMQQEEINGGGCDCNCSCGCCCGCGCGCGCGLCGCSCDCFCCCECGCGCGCNCCL